MSSSFLYYNLKSTLFYGLYIVHFLTDDEEICIGGVSQCTVYSIICLNCTLFFIIEDGKFTKYFSCCWILFERVAQICNKGKSRT